MPEIVEGMNALQAQFRQLEYSMQRTALLEAAKAGGDIAAEEMRRLAPRDTGGMADSIKARPLQRESDIHEGTVTVGPTKKFFYWLFQEKGTSNHRAQPFMGPALATTKPHIIQAIKDKLWSFIQAAIR